MLPVEAQANLSIRLAPGQSPAEIAPVLERLLHEAAPEWASLDVELWSTGEPGFVDPAAPAVRIAQETFEHVLGNERDNAKLVPILGLKSKFDLNYNNHYMGGVAFNELMCRLIFLIRLLKVDTVVSWDPWAHDEENPDHHMTARGVEAACWMAGRDHDYPEQFAAGLKPHAVREKLVLASESYATAARRAADEMRALPSVDGFLAPFE